MLPLNVFITDAGFKARPFVLKGKKALFGGFITPSIAHKHQGCFITLGKQHYMNCRAGVNSRMVCPLWQISSVYCFKVRWCLRFGIADAIIITKSNGFEILRDLLSRHIIHIKTTPPNDVSNLQKGNSNATKTHLGCSSYSGKHPQFLDILWLVWSKSNSCALEQLYYAALKTQNYYC